MTKSVVMEQELELEELTAKKDFNFLSKPQPTEVEDIVGPVNSRFFINAVKKIYRIHMSVSLASRLGELAKHYKSYCYSEPPDTEMSLQLWLWEHIIDTYKALREPLAGFPDEVKSRALTFLTILLTNAFKGRDCDDVMKDITRGVPLDFEEIVINKARPYLRELKAELSRV